MGGLMAEKTDADKPGLSRRALLKQVGLAMFSTKKPARASLDGGSPRHGD